MSNVITHVANASGGNLGVYFSPDEMSLQEIEVVFGTRVSDSKIDNPSDLSADVQMAMRRNTRIQYIRIPVSDYSKILTEGGIYVSVFMDDHFDSCQCLKIAHNFYVPGDRSIIITANRGLKFQKYGANIWEDEDGYNHKP